MNKSDNNPVETNANLFDKKTETLYRLPFVPDIWDAPADALDLSTDRLLEILQSHQRSGTLREIGPIFNADLLGYRSTLAAGILDDDQIETVASAVSDHPGVSHNYLREGGAYNLWFTLTVPGDRQAIDRELESLRERTGVPFRSFPSLERYKISFQLTPTPVPNDHLTPTPFHRLDRHTQQKLSIAIQILQRGLPLEPDPFGRLAGDDGRLSKSELLEAGETLKRCGILRRLGAIWRHRKIGLNENILCLWRLPDAAIEPFVRKVMEIPLITHCYRRQSYPDWPWPIYTMIHGSDSSACRRIMDRLKNQFPQTDLLPMRTLREFKKSRVIYRPSIGD